MKISEVEAIYNLHKTQPIIFHKGRYSKVVNEFMSTVFSGEKVGSKKYECYVDLFINMLNAYLNDRCGMLFNSDRNSYHSKMVIGDKEYRSNTYFLGAMSFKQHLVDKGWVVHIKGTKNVRNSDEDQFGRIIFIDKFYEFMSQYEKSEVKTPKLVKSSVVLRSKEKKVLKIKLNLLHVKESKEFLDTYNEWIKGFDICVNDSKISCETYRLFIDNEESYGRLHASYQSMKKEMRELIKIDGESTVELDVSSAHLNILYGMVSIDPEDCILYDYEQINEVTEEFRSEYGLEGITRDDMKIMVMIMINTKSKSQAVNTVYNQERFNKYKNAREFVEELVRLIEELHCHVSHLFYSNLAMSLMFKESSFLIRVLKQLKDNNTPCLSIHDSILVKEGDKAFTINTMKGTFYDMFGVTAEIKEK